MWPFPSNMSSSLPLKTKRVFFRRTEGCKLWGRCNRENKGLILSRKFFCSKINRVLFRIYKIMKREICWETLREKWRRSMSWLLFHRRRKRRRILWALWRLSTGRMRLRTAVSPCLVNERLTSFFNRRILSQKLSKPLSQCWALKARLASIWNSALVPLKSPFL